MKDILKNEWGHVGLVVTDWGAINDRVLGLRSGNDLEMLGAPNGNNDMIVAAVKSGDMSLLDQAVERILSMVIKAKETLAQDLTYDRQAHHPLARRVAGEGTALLKNDGDILPIGEKSRVSLIGQFVKTPRYQGAGSSLVNPTLLDNLHDEMVALAGNANLVYAPGY